MSTRGGRCHAQCGARSGSLPILHYAQQGELRLHAGLHAMTWEVSRRDRSSWIRQQDTKVRVILSTVSQLVRVWLARV